MYRNIYHGIRHFDVCVFINKSKYLKNKASEENRFYFREGSHLWVVIWAHVGDIYNSLREKCPYSELVWSAFFRIRTEYEEIFRVSPYSVQMRENADQNNSEYRHILHSGISLLPQQLLRKAFLDEYNHTAFDDIV